MIKTETTIKKSYAYYFGRYIKIGLPILLTSLTPILMSEVDNAMVGYLGKAVRAAAAFSNVITAIAFLLLIGVSSVLMPIVAGAVVKDRYDQATRALQYSIVVNMVCGVFCMFCLFILSFFLGSFGQDKQVVELASGGYFQIIVFSILPNTITQPLKRFFDGIGWRFTNMSLSLLSACLNVFFNYILIYGNWGFPALGINGAGIGTLMSRIIMMFVYIGLAFSFKRQVSKQGFMTSFSLGTWDSKYFQKILKLGLPAGFELGAKMIYLSIINIMIGWIGVTEQSSASILFGIERIGLMFPTAIGTAGSILLAQEWKMGNKIGIVRARYSAYFLGVGSMALLSIITLGIIPFMLDYLYYPRKEVREMVATLAFFVILLQVSDGFTFIGTGLLRGMRDTFVPFMITILVSFFIGLPLSYGLAFYLKWGIRGIFQGLILGLLCAAFLLYARFSFQIKRVRTMHISSLKKSKMPTDAPTR